MGRIAIIGAGIAGVATAAALARRGREVLLLERAGSAGAGSSGLNAAIFRLAVAEPVNVELALRSRAIGSRVVRGGSVRDVGALYPSADAVARSAILAASAKAGVRDATADEIPSPLRGRIGAALFSPEDGIIDVHALLHGLLREALAHGAELRLGTPAVGLERAAGRVVGVNLAGRTLSAEVVVDASGAFSPELPGAADSDVGIRPYRRHLFVLESPLAARFSGVAWDLDAGYYVRPESGGLLASPCDETAMSGCDPVPTSEDAASLLFEKLARACPPLADARVRRFWAGLRPLTADHRFIIGPDPRISGLFRVGGFGGHGMTAGPAAGEVAAAILCGEREPLEGELSPSRFLSKD